MLLYEALSLFLSEYIPTTKQSYAQKLNPMVEYCGAARPISHVSSVDLLRFVQSVRERDTINSPETINGYVKTIKVFFNWAKRIGEIDHSPADALKQRSVHHAPDRSNAMPEDVLEMLLDYAKWHPRINALVLFLADTGCRRGGAAGLRWYDVDLTHRRASVTEKGDKTRPVFFAEDAAIALHQWQHRQKRTAGSFVFSLHGEGITSAAVAQVFRRAAQKSGAGSWGPHSLRHRKGFQGADARIAPSVMATLLGHENVETTLVSYYPRDFDRAEAAARELAHHHTPPANSTKVVRPASFIKKTSPVTEDKA